MRSGILNGPRRPGVILCMLCASIAGASSADEPLPWEVWKDLGEIARLGLDHQVVMRSSRCPDGCAYDRHSDGDSRFIRSVGDEGVIFELEGAGAITRIWMTQGEGGISQPLDGDIRLRLTLDGAAAPVLDLPLPEVFGVWTPFTPPLAVDRQVASGGNISYVPIAFRDGCRLSLVGAEAERIWFQIGGHRLASPDGVTTFTGSEDLSAWRALLDSPGDDPWPDGNAQPSISGRVLLQPGQTEVLASFDGPDSLTALRLGLPSSRWSELTLTLVFDESERTELALDDFFAIGRATGQATRSLLIGVDADDELYSYFPMPFFRTATVALGLSDAAASPVEVDSFVRRRDQVPPADSGLFGAQLRVADPSTPGLDSSIAIIDGPGRWVGLFLEAGSIGNQSQAFLEGDERIFADGSPHPALYGTGVEDFFGGGFYYRIDSLTSTPFRRALHGMTYDLTDGAGRAMGMYRLMLTDAPVFGARLDVGLEGGPTNQTEVRFRAVSYFYRRSTPPARRRDLFDLGDPDSRLSHFYAWTGHQVCADLDALFEDEPPTGLVAPLCGRDEGNATFVMRGARPGQRVSLRRRLDAGISDQRATISINGAPASVLGFVDPNPHRRWRERERLIGLWGAEDLDAAVSIDVPGSSQGFTEARWELWAGYPPGTCDRILDGVCDAADLAAVVRSVAGGPDPGELSLTMSATFD